MRTTVCYAGYGQLEQGGSWANCQTIGMFEDNENRVGCMPGKMKIAGPKSIEVASRLVEQIRMQGGPIEIDAVVGQVKGKDGGAAMALVDFTLVSQPSPNKLDKAS